MPKTKISEFSATPANNTDIDSINIAEGCAPSGINDAIRELMSQLKDFQTGAVGDSFNGPVNGTLGATTPATASVTTLAASGAVTLSGGTANGVTYLNGSKVLTSGSALTFDGTNFGVGGAAVFTGALAVLGNSTAGSNIKLYEDTDNGTNYVSFKAPDTIAANVTWTLPSADGTSAQVLSTNGSGTLSWATGGSSQWTTTGSDIYYTTGKVGIGTATPAYNLDVARSGNGVSARFSQGTFSSYIYSGSTVAYFMSDTGALTSYGITASTLNMSAGNGADQLVVSQTSVKPNVLLDISGSSAGQIKFPATQNASTDANTLDDYEEGTFTPTIIGGTTAGTGTYSNQTGFYTKIGNMVYFYAQCAWSAHTGTGTMSFSGLPFTISADTPGSTSVYMETAVTLTAGNVLQMRLTPSSTNVLFAQYATGGSNASAVAFDTSADVRISGQYKI